MFPSPSLCTFVFIPQTMSSSIHISTPTVHSHIHCSLKRYGRIFFTNGFKLMFLEIVLIVFLQRGLVPYSFWGKEGETKSWALYLKIIHHDCLKLTISLAVHYYELEWAGNQDCCLVMTFSYSVLQ